MKKMLKNMKEISIYRNLNIKKKKHYLHKKLIFMKNNLRN